MCGHTFEVIEYYMILKDKFKTGILITDSEITWGVFECAILSKYNFSDIEIEDIKRNTRFAGKPKLLKGRNILFTDGGMSSVKNNIVLFDNIIYFACGDLNIKNNDANNTWVLQDNRVYDKVLKNGINYKKKILFDRFKKIDNSKKQYLLYGTKNCRDIDIKNYKEIVDKYGSNIIAITNKKNQPKIRIDGINFVIPPVTDIFENFVTYIYTETNKKWDCSPRFICECQYYGKEVVYHNINYLEQDKGLYWRKWDLENDFDSLYLTKSDEIITILKKIIKI
jgi:hypothetical protein